MIVVVVIAIARTQARPIRSVNRAGLALPGRSGPADLYRSCARRAVRGTMSPMRLSLALAIAVPATLAGAVALAHVAPAIGDNNRYLKLTPLADRVRLAYTVFYGQVPGAALRKTIDANRDGTIDDGESQAFAAPLATRIAAALDITIDGIRQPVHWSQVVVGMGSSSTNAGAFSVDLIASLCLASPRGKHTVLLRDSFPLERPGETEVKLDDSPGITLDASRIGGAVDETHAYTLVGPSGALETEGLELSFTAGPTAPLSTDAACSAAPARSLPIAVIAITGAIVAAMLAGGAAVILRHRRHRGLRATRARRR